MSSLRTLRQREPQKPSLFCLHILRLRWSGGCDRGWQHCQPGAGKRAVLLGGGFGCRTGVPSGPKAQELSPWVAYCIIPRELALNTNPHSNVEEWKWRVTCAVCRCVTRHAAHGTLQCST